MTPESQSLWRELLKRAGPCSAVPAVDAAQCCASVAIAADGAEPALAELVNVGAIAVLTIDELEKIARRERLSGDFIRWESRGSAQFFRVADPNDLHQAAVAEIELMRRQDTQLQNEQRELELDLSGERVPETWSNRWGGPLQQQAYEFWREGCARVRADARYLSEKAPPEQNLVLSSFKVVASQLLGNLRSIQQRRDLIRAVLERLSKVTNPAWASGHSSGVNRREQIPKAVQQDVWRRDQGRCVECGSKENLEFDHIIPVSKGGATTARNLQLLCEPCNRRKNNRI